VKRGQTTAVTAVSGGKSKYAKKTVVASEHRKANSARRC